MPSNSARGGALGAVLTVIGILVLVAMVGMVAGGLYIAHHVRVESSAGAHGHNVSIETPFGSMHVREDLKADPKRFGVPVYPGAVLAQDHHKLAKVEFNFGSDESQGFAIVAGEYTTSDPIEKVRQFYQGELPHWMVSDDHRGRVHFSFKEGGYQKIVVLERRGDTTRIALASIGAPASN
jgi:hypothetical protein